MKNLTYLILLLGFLVVSCSGGGSGTQSEEGAESDESAATEGSMIKGVEMTYSTDSTTMHGYLAFDANIEGKRPDQSSSKPNTQKRIQHHKKIRQSDQPPYQTERGRSA